MPTDLLVASTDDLLITPTNFLLTTPTDNLVTTPTNPLMTTPTIIEINQHIIPYLALDWVSIGLHLEVEHSILMDIADYDDDVGTCCRTMFTRWLAHEEGTGVAPRIWRTVLKALKNTGYISLVGDVERMLFDYLT